MRWFKVAAIAVGILVAFLVVGSVIGAILHLVIDVVIAAAVVGAIVVAVKVARSRRQVSGKKAEPRGKKGTKGTASSRQASNSGCSLRLVRL